MEKIWTLDKNVRLFQQELWACFSLIKFKIVLSLSNTFVENVTLTAVKEQDTSTIED